MGLLSSIFSKKYAGHDEAMIISCFFNPMNSPYRLRAFNTFRHSIEHLNHRILECVIGDGEPQLKGVECIRTESLLWHKEALLNNIVTKLPKKFKYIFWVDADVLFTNKKWLVDGVEQLESNNVIQPFEYCIHLDRDEEKPNFKVDDYRSSVFSKQRHPQMWRSFAANYATSPYAAKSDNYNLHGHVGFAWGARRAVLDACPLYDRALIGGADHIIAHAAAGHIPHPCITKAFSDDIDNVLAWSSKFYSVVNGFVGFAKGDLYHLWHGDIEKRQYLQRIKDFTGKTKQIRNKDKHGLYVTDHDDTYIRNYFRHREARMMGDFFYSILNNPSLFLPNQIQDEQVISDASWDIPADAGLVPVSPDAQTDCPDGNCDCECNDVQQTPEENFS